MRGGKSPMSKKVMCLHISTSQRRRHHFSAANATAMTSTVLHKFAPDKNFKCFHQIILGEVFVAAAVGKPWENPRSSVE